MLLFVDCNDGTRLLSEPSITENHIPYPELQPQLTRSRYIQGLAQKFASGDLTTEFLMKAPYEEVFEKLVAVRGLGAWSVEMFACFGLKRLDVFSTGDLGVQ